MANTLTSTQVARVASGVDFPIALPGRLCAVHVKFNPNGTSLSASDVIQMVAVPDHARIVDVMFTRNGTQPINFEASVGHQAASLTGAYIQLNTFSVTTGVLMRRPSTAMIDGVDTRISVSASSEGFGFDTIDVNVVSTSACVTGSYQMTVYYLYEPGT